MLAKIPRGLDRKMRRRIKRFIASGESQARVRCFDVNLYGYVVQHKIKMIQFRRTKMGRLRRLS